MPHFGGGMDGGQDNGRGGGAAQPGRRPASPRHGHVPGYGHQHERPQQYGHRGHDQPSGQPDGLAGSYKQAVSLIQEKTVIMAPWG
jgi:hypothetical protein